MDGIRGSAAQRICQKVLDVPSRLPEVICKLISDYAVEDFSAAELPLLDWSASRWSGSVEDPETGKFRGLSLLGFPIVDLNRPRLAAIRRALTSNVCEFSVKTQIFNNIRNSDYVHMLNKLFDEIREDGEQINLDNCNFDGLRLSKLNLSGASAVFARFSNMNMSDMVLKNIDFSGAMLINTTMKSSDLSGTSFYKALLENCEITDSDLTNVDGEKASFNKVKFQDVIMNGYKTRDVQLCRAIGKSKVWTGGIRHYPREVAYTGIVNWKLIDYSNKKNVDSVYYFTCDFTSGSASLKVKINLPMPKVVDD